jgi:hypothetical protein
MSRQTIGRHHPYPSVNIILCTLFSFAQDTSASDLREGPFVKEHRQRNIGPQPDCNGSFEPFLADQGTEHSIRAEAELSGFTSFAAIPSAECR